MASPRAKPLALEENVLEDPSGLKTPWSDRLVTVLGDKKRLVPPTIAALQSPFAMAMHASFRPIIEEEQAVRMVKL
jgi:hypothetical protein